MALLGALELGLQVYYAFHGPPSYSSQSLKLGFSQLPPPSSSKFSLPTNISKKAVYNSSLDNYQPHLLDDQDAYFPTESRDDVYTYSPNHSQELIEKLNTTGEILYKVTMSTDEWGRRITPAKDKGKKSKHLVFYGCSYTAGEGVGQEETIPYFTAAATNDYRAYNLAVNGGNVSEAWSYTHHLDKLQDIPEKKGYAFYIFFDDHIPRYKGNIQNIHEWIYSRPLVRPETDGKIKYYGLWRNARPFAVWLSHVLSHSALLKTLKFNFPPIYPQDLDDFVKVLASVRDGYWKKFGSDNPFIVVFYFKHAEHYAPLLKPLLERENIPYLDYSIVGLHQLSDRKLTIPYDSHPNALAHKIVGEQIAEDLKLQ